MLLLNLFDRLGREVPGAPMSGFIATVNSEVESIWKVRKWDHFVTEVEFSTAHSFDNLTVTNGVDTATVVDGDAGGLFDALHVAKTMTIGGKTYTVDSVTDANTLVLGALSSDTGTGLAGSLPRVVFSLPNGEVVAAVTAPIFRKMMKVFRQGAEFEQVLVDRCEYLLRYPSAGVTVLELHTTLSGDTPYVVRFVRAPVKATVLNDSVDLGELLDECLYWRLEYRYRSKRPPVSEIDMLPWQRLVSAAQTRGDEELKGAKAAETLKHARRGRMAEVVFRL